MAKPPRNEQERFIRFLIVGAFNTVVDFGLMNLFTAVLNLPFVLAQALSFTIAVISSYILNRVWIYPEARGGQIKAQFPKFVIINLLGLTIRSIFTPLIDKGLLSLFTKHPVQLLGLSQNFFSHNGALALIIPCTLTMNFLLNRAWTFKVKPVQNTSTEEHL